MTPREFCFAFANAIGAREEKEIDRAAKGLAELLAAREPAKVAPIGVGSRFVRSYAQKGQVWTVVCESGRYNLSNGEERWLAGGVAYDRMAQELTDTRGQWVRLPDEPDHAADVARLTAELAARDKAFEALTVDLNQSATEFASSGQRWR